MPNPKGFQEIDKDGAVERRTVVRFDGLGDTDLCEDVDCAKSQDDEGGRFRRYFGGTGKREI